MKKSMKLVSFLLALALLLPNLASCKWFGGEDDPKKKPLLEGEAYYKIGTTEYTDMVVMYPQLSMADVFQIAVHNSDGEEYLFYHYNDGKKNFLYMGQFLSGSYDAGSSPSFYMPDIAQNLTDFDYTTLYDGTMKIPALFSAVGAIVVGDRIYQWEESTDAAEVDATLDRFGLGQADNAPWFEVVPYLKDNYGQLVYAVTSEEDKLVCYNPANKGYYYTDGAEWHISSGKYTYDEAYRYSGSISDLSPAADKTAAKRVYVGSATADDGGFYVMLEGRRVVYTTASVSSDLATIDLANVVNRSLSYYVEPRLLTDAATLYDPFFTPSFKLQSGTLYTEAGEGVKLGDKTCFSYKNTVFDQSAASESGKKLYEIKEDDTLSLCLSALKVGDKGIDLLWTDPLVRAVTDGEQIAYKITSIDFIFDPSALNLIGAVGDTRAVSENDIILVSFEVAGSASKGAIHLKNASAEVKTAFVGKAVGDLEEDILLSHTYTKTDGMQKAVYKITSIDAISHASTYVADTVAAGDTVTFSYTLYLDGEAVQSGSYTLVANASSENVSTRELSRALIGRGKGTQNNLQAEVLFADDALLEGYTVYLNAEVESTAHYKTDLSFGYFYYVNESGQKDVFQSDSIYLIEGPDELKMYSIDSSVAQNLLSRFSGMMGAETVAIGIDEQSMVKYGLYAYHLTYALPYNSNANMQDDGNVTSMTCDYTVYYDLYISEKDEKGVRYVASTQFGTVVKVTDGSFDFVEWDFYEDIARNNVFMTNVENIKEISVSANYTDKKDTHTFVLSLDKAYGESKDGHRLYVSYVNGEAETETVFYSAGGYTASAGVIVEQAGAVAQRVTTVKNGTDIDALFAGYTDTSGYDKAGVVYFRRFVSSLYHTRYMGLVSADKTEAEIAALLENEQACLLSMRITLIDGRVYTFRFIAYSAARMMVSVSGVDKNGADLGESHLFFVNRSEVDKLFTMTDKLSLGIPFTENDGY